MAEKISPKELLSPKSAGVLVFKDHQSTHKYFCVHLPVKGGPKTVCQIEKCLRFLRDEEWDFGRAAALAVASAAVMGAAPRLMYHEEIVDKPGHYVYHFNRLCASGPALVLMNGKSLFSGTRERFQEWCETATELPVLTLKTVRFRYAGGTKRGEERLVRVNEVRSASSVMTSDGPESRVHIWGQDLSHPDLNEAFRRYDLSKIEGDIEVLN